MILFIIHYNSKIASIKLTMIQLSACFDQKNRTDKTYISTVLLMVDILRPIINEYSGSGMGNRYMKGTHFAIAKWEWIQSGFRVTGTEV